MGCVQTSWLTNEQYAQQLARRVIEQRVPISGSLELTRRCNLRCVHCYVGPLKANDALCNEEMTTRQTIRVLDQITEEGCLFLLITGGEPLLRHDFVDIYRHAKRNGLLVTVFTNGTLINDRIVALFEELPPRAVEITLYGATSATYERITQVVGSYERCLRGIERLIDHGIRLQLKTMLMTLNRHEFDAMRALAEGYGVEFRFDPAIFPRFDGDRSVLRFRVSSEEATEREFEDPNRVHHWRQYWEQRRDLPVSAALYDCGAGRTAFHIDPYGNLQPCLMTTSCKYDLMQGSFRTAWQEAMPRFRERKAAETNACNACPHRILCASCPAFAGLESGDEDARSEYLCAMTALRWAALNGKH